MLQTPTQSSLLQKIFDVSPQFEDVSSAVAHVKDTHEILKVESDIMNDVAVGASKVVKKSLSGGKLKDNKMEYFQRWNLYIFIFFLSVFFAILTMKDKNLVASLLKRSKINDMANDLGNENLRWKRVTEFTVVFVALVFAYNLAFVFGMFIWLAIGRLFVERNEPLKASWKKIFWKYTNEWGEQVFIGKTYFLTLILVCFLTFVCYIGFSKWFKDWLNSLYFQTNQNKKQAPQTQKYIHYYALFLIIMFIFFVMLIDVKQLKDNKLYMFYNIAFFMAFLIMALSIFKDFLNGNRKKLAFVVLLLFLMFFLYPILMTMLMMETNIKSILNRNFFKKVIFDLSIPY